MKHFLVAAMLMVSASCAAFNLQPNKVSEPFSWKWNWFQEGNTLELNLVCPVCKGESFSIVSPPGSAYYYVICNNCGWYALAKENGELTPASVLQYR